MAPMSRSGGRSGLPRPLGRMIGRDAVVAQIASHVRSRRFVSIVGIGGLGKSTVAIAAAHVLEPEFPNGAQFVDLAPVATPELVPAAVAAALSIQVGGDDPLQALLAWLEGKSLLLLLDTCEAQIEAAAQLCDAITRQAPSVSLLATSREPLRTIGEWIYRIEPLELPEDDSALTAKSAIGYSSIELLVERASVNQSSFSIRDEDAPVAARICNRLDGIPLAIELAAAHVGTFGLRGLAVRLESSFQLLPLGRRTADLRHHTLTATLDWSFGLLSKAEQVALRRLSVFRNRFELDTGLDVVAETEGDRTEAITSLLGLVSQSLLVADVTQRPTTYRMLDMTRQYAAAKLADGSDSEAVARRHALVMEAALSVGRNDRLLEPRAWLNRYAPMIDDARAAMTWAFARPAESRLAIDVTIAVIRLAQQLNLQREFRGWTQRAISLLHETGTTDPAANLSLQVYLADFIYQTEGVSPEMVAASSAIEAVGRHSRTAINEIAIPLNAKWALLINTSHYLEAQDMAQKLLAAAIHAGAPEYVVLARKMLAQSLHFSGDHRNARAVAQEVLTNSINWIPLTALDKRVSMGIILARLEWMEGNPERAARLAEEAVALAEGGNTTSVCQALGFAAISIALWSGDLGAASRYNARLESVSQSRGFIYWGGWSRQFRTCLSLASDGRTGEPGSATGMMDPEPDAMQLDHLATINVHLTTEALAQRLSVASPVWNTAEALRAWGEQKVECGDLEVAEGLFRQALEIAVAQNALSWELRAGMSLACLYRETGRSPQARELLAPIHARFTEGFGTTDLLASAALLRDLRSER